jgi:anti-sigma regulatory factor (Ser/Thr protein kinase)
VLVKRWTRNPQRVAQARHELRQVLEEWDLTGLADSAELVLSELFTNAVRHARAPRDRQIETRYERLPDGVRIEVHDANEKRPKLQVPSPDAESGHGLALVNALTRGRWGVDGRNGCGKLVWACVTDDSAEEQPRAVGLKGARP